MGAYSKKLRSRIDILGGQRTGHCVICGTVGPLSADHVPPKGCIQITDTVLKSMVPPQDGSRGHLIQGGIKFRTICSTCNNTRLGALHDPHLKDFVDQIRHQMIVAPVTAYIPRIFEASFSAHHIAKAIVGHILAAHSVKETAEFKDDIGANSSLRQYFLAAEGNFPPDWKLFCWPNFYREQVILRHFAIADMGFQNVDDESPTAIFSNSFLSGFGSFTSSAPKFKSRLTISLPLPPRTMN